MPAETRLRRTRSLYVHVPFCLSVCPYCDFVVYGGRAATEAGGMLDAFHAALLRELELRTSGRAPVPLVPPVPDPAPAPVAPPVPDPAPAPLDTVYLGGGTPSLLGPRRVATLLKAIDRYLGIAAGAEITLEVNPGDRDRGDLRGFVAAGVTRVSIGAQSLVSDELRRLGRRHAVRDAGTTVRAGRRAGATSVSLDLLYDVPGQTLASWGRSLDGAIAIDPDHVSAYALSLDDPDTEGLTGPVGDHLPVRPGARRWRERARRAQDPGRAAEMYELADGRLERAGFAWYELSNWARAGHRSRHNLAYWRRRPYLALGPGAHGFDGAIRWWNAARLDAYLAALLPADAAPPALPPGGAEKVSGRARLSERAFLGLRLCDGLGGRTLRGLRRDRDIRDALAWGLDEGLLQGDGALGEVPLGEGALGDGPLGEGPLTLTMRGRLLADQLFVRLA